MALLSVQQRRGQAMTFDEVLDQVRALLQSKGRVTYRALKRRFELDDEYLADLTAELVKAEGVAADENGEVLVWAGKNTEEEKAKRGNGGKEVVSSQFSVVSTPHSVPSTQPSAERRQLTVMFCDLVGSTALSTQLDPEELREVVQAYQETGTAVVRRYEGHIAQHLGDGLLVYFGYPVAHEDDAARAVRAGLEILEALRLQVPSPLKGEGQGEGEKVTQLQTTPHPNLLPQGEKGLQKLQVRIGIHTGLVVIGEIGSSEKREILALGETPNLAARIQGQANPDEVIISAAAYRLIEGLFEAEELGQPELKGVATPLTLYRIAKEGDAHSRFEVVVRRGLTPLIGREHEFGLLHDRWMRVKDGTGQVVLLSGEPGIGKSRLVEALKETVEHEGSRCLELRCSPYTQNSALAPVIEHLQRLLQFRPDDSSDERLQKLIVGAHSCVPLRSEIVPLLAALLSLPHPEGYPVLTLSPQKQKEKTNEALVAWLCAEAQHQAVVYAWEDLHWADPSTLELLTLFLQQVPTTRVLAVFTYRPEFTPPWGAHSYLSQLTLSRLGPNHVETMVKKVTGNKILPKEVVQQIVSKTDGVPLFVEELTKSVVEQNVGAYSNTPLLGIPTTLQDALMARLDRLETAKEIAQLGATLGREFNYELLAAVSPLNEDILQQGLKQLVESELVYQSGVPPQARYFFKHALGQDTAYQSLLKSRRQQLHQAIGKVLEEQFSQTVETQPELVAHHYTEANLIEQAIPYWQQAGQRAIERSANVEAASYLMKGIELLQILPNTLERAQQELTLLMALGTPLVATKGYAAPEVEHAYTRARELCQQIGTTSRLFPILLGLAGFYAIRGELRTARELEEQSLCLAQNMQNPAYLMWAHFMLGNTVYYLGEFAPAQAHLQKSATLYDPQKHWSHRAVQDLGVTIPSITAWALWSLGYPEQALKRSHEALILARERDHPFSLAFALSTATRLHQFRREIHAVRELAEALIALSIEQRFEYFLAHGKVLRGWAQVAQGAGEKGTTQLRQGVAAYQATGAEIERSHWLALLAEAYGRIEQPEEGLRVLTGALGEVQQNGIRYYEAELYRLKGTLTLQSKVQGPKFKVEDETEGYFLKAIEIAQNQQAKSLELRAATSLACLWQQQGKKAEAHKLLSEVYNWFTEGFDTKDLQEAKALLDSLESQKV